MHTLSEDYHLEYHLHVNSHFQGELGLAGFPSIHNHQQHLHFNGHFPSLKWVSHLLWYPFSNYSVHVLWR